MNPQSDTDAAMVELAADKLSEHFDTVQIFVTRHDEATERGTTALVIGVGNHFARYGQARLWVKKEGKRYNQEEDL